MKKPEEKPELDASKVSANAFGIMGSVSKALRKAGADEEYIKQYENEAMSSDYNHLLSVSMEYVDFI